MVVLKTAHERSSILPVLKSSNRSAESCLIILKNKPEVKLQKIILDGYGKINLN